MLPLVTRTAKALASWLAPAWSTTVELRPDLDQIEALTAEREASCRRRANKGCGRASMRNLAPRIEKVSFLTLNEKREATRRRRESEPSLVVREYPVAKGARIAPDYTG